MFSDEQILIAINAVRTRDFFYEHSDCVRIAYQWLDAQVKMRSTSRQFRCLKNYIERWAGRYVSATDVEAAAFLHPGVKGEYPYYNIGVRLIEPDLSRLTDIAEAFTQGYRCRHDPRIFARKE